MMGLKDEFGLEKTDTGENGNMEAYEDAIEDTGERKLDKLREIYKEFDNLEKPSPPYSYEPAVRFVENVDIPKGSLYEFCKEYKPGRKYGGIFVSAMMNEGSEEEEFTLPDMGGVDRIGYRNQKRITVEGDVGKIAGWGMEDGEIVIEGDAGDYVGEWMKDGGIEVGGDAGDFVGWEMEDGEIVVEGDAGRSVGDYVEGGEIVVEGDAGSDVGFGMLDGEIRIKGSVESLSDYIKGGEIYTLIDNSWGKIYPDSGDE